jgi:L-ribulokinase
MQIQADVLRLPLSVIESQQGPALGSAIHAAVAAGAYPDVRTAAASMGRRRRAAYLPDPDRAASYDRLFREYLELHDHFGRDVAAMRRLAALRGEAADRRAVVPA